MSLLIYRVVVCDKIPVFLKLARSFMPFKPSKSVQKSKGTFSDDKGSSVNKIKLNFTGFSWILKDVLVLSCIGLSFFLFIILFSYHPEDPGFEAAATGLEVLNYGGLTGAWLSSFILYFFGIFGFLIPFGVFMAGWVTLKIRVGSEFDYSRFILSLIGLFLLIASGGGLATLYLEPDMGFIQFPYSSGGVLGYELSKGLVSSIDLLGATLALLVIFAVSFSLFISYSWLNILDATGVQTFRLYLFLKQQMQVLQASQQKKKAYNKVSPASSKDVYDKKMLGEDQTTSKRSGVHSLLNGKNKVIALFGEKKDQPIAKRAEKAFVGKEYVKEKNFLKKNPQPSDEGMQLPTDVKVGQRATSNSTVPFQESGDLPSVELLDPIPEYTESFSEQALKDLSLLLEQRLQEFGVSVKVEAVQPGPVVTRFEIMPAAGVKVSQINNLAKDLARVLSIKSVRVVDVIPGKAVVGIEIPNDEREMVSFREVVSSVEFQTAKSALTVALGKDIAGKTVVADIAKMPHLLVAGTTGSGKSVGINSMILSLLYKATPEEVRLIMIDPKMLELSVYEDIPHLLTPVVTDMNDAANALRWCVFEMDRRYQLMAKLGVRNIAGYNAKVQGAIDSGKPMIDPLYQQAVNFGHELGEKPPTLESLPYIVVVVDEFADMIMVVGKEVEQLISRIAQKARAAGIHLILATQRPSVNVITGLIKANIPTRISFMVNTKIDSRTILDQGGGEQLLGMGDMLFMPPGTGSPKRVHGAFMSDEEVHAVAKFVKSQGKPQYLEAVTQTAKDNATEGGEDAEMDKLYDEVVGFVIEGRRVSVSSVQRRFKIGYNRAARIVEAMENSGVVSTMGANGNREVLAPKPAQ